LATKVFDIFSERFFTQDFMMILTLACSLTNKLVIELRQKFTFSYLLASGFAKICVIMKKVHFQFSGDKA